MNTAPEGYYRSYEKDFPVNPETAERIQFMKEKQEGKHEIPKLKDASPEFLRDFADLVKKHGMIALFDFSVSSGPPGPDGRVKNEAIPMSFDLIHEVFHYAADMKEKNA